MERKHRSDCGREQSSSCKRPTRAQMSQATTYPRPAYYRRGHSIELSLKSFLFGCGVPLPRLKTLAHNLRALPDEAECHNIQ